MSLEDELEDLVKRILLLNYRLKAQVEALNQQKSTLGHEYAFPQDNANLLRELVKTPKRE